jgi:DNA mismatch repair ATPase MutS
LLYPLETAANPCEIYNELDPAAQRDLGIDSVVAGFTNDKERQKEIRKTLYLLIQDPYTIRYRQDVLEDFLANPDLVERLEILFPVIDTLVRYTHRTERRADSLQGVIWRLGELQSVLDCIQGLGDIFNSIEEELHSRGLLILKEEVRKIIDHPTYQHLVKELPELLTKIRACVSITIGVNLDASLRPVQAVLLSVNDERFTDQSLINKLFGLRGEQAGIAPLHSVPQRAVDGAVALPIAPELGWAVEPMMVPLFADLSKVLQKATVPIAKRLQQYTEIQGRMFVTLRGDLMFYLGAVRFINALRENGLPVCRPEIAPAEERICDVQDSYNVNLALHSISVGSDLPVAIVKNSIKMGPYGRIYILTGPNQGGKTTYLQGVGVMQLLAQVGCYIPGTHALISPVDQIFSHFPIEEKPETEKGRFGEEAMRLGKIFEHLTGSSLVLLNESLSSTSLGESLYLAQDVVRILRRTGVRAIYSTHIFELAQRAGELNESVLGDSLIISVVSSPVDVNLQLSIGEVKRTYKVEIRPPLSHSYAREIAARYGIGYEQMEKALMERGVL